VNGLEHGIRQWQGHHTSVGYPLYFILQRPSSKGSQESFLLDQSWRRGKRMSTYGAAAKLVMRILTCLFIYLTRTHIK